MAGNGNGNGRPAPSYSYLAAMRVMDEMVTELRRSSRWAERLLADEDAMAELSAGDRFGETFADDLEEHADGLRSLLRRLSAWKLPGGEWGGAEEQHGPGSHGGVLRRPGAAEPRGMGRAGH